MANPAETQTAFRRQSLKSETHRVLFRILSHCRDLSQLSDQDDGSDGLGEETGRGGGAELDENDGVSECDDSAEAQRESVADESGFGDGIEQIEEFFNVEGNEVDIGIDFGDLDIGPGETMSMEELEKIVRGSNQDEEDAIGSLVAKDKDVVLSNREQCEESRQDATVVGAVDADKQVLGEIQNGGETSEQTCSLLKTSVSDVEPIIQLKAADTSMAFASTFMVGDASMPSESSLSPIVNDFEQVHEPQPNDEEMEEGEISEDDGSDDRSTDMILHDTVTSEENNEVQILKDVDDQIKHSGKEALFKEFDSNSFLRSIADNVQYPRGEESSKCRSKTIGRPGVEAIKEGIYAFYGPSIQNQRIEEKDSGNGNVGFTEPCSNNQGSHDKISARNEPINYGTLYEEEEDAGATKKRKRPSKEKKQRKKAKERLKRAEMNRQQGVKRLKLHNIEKPKPVVYCRHYIAGRCHEGENCKYSHDTVPLTKSKPCSHFARRVCLKGDDCPFDHQLSKYLCDNFVKNGSCFRGDRCLFSHKIPSTEEGDAAASKPESVPPSGRGSSRSTQVNIASPSQKDSHALPHLKGAQSQNNTELLMARILLEQPTVSTKGFSFLSTGKQSLVHSIMPKQGVSAPDRNFGEKSGNRMQQSPSSSVSNTKEAIIKTSTAVAPKGINFLSFGKASLDSSSGKNQSHPQTSLSVSATTHNFDVAPKDVQPAQSKASDFHSAGKAPLSNSSGGNPFSLLPSTSDSGNSTRFDDGKSASDQLHCSSAGPSSRSLPSPLTPGQYSGYTESRFKNTVNQRVLCSTLAFAAKYESKKTNLSIGSTCTQVDRETKQNDSGKAFNIFDFMSSIGSTTKQ